MSRWKDQTKIGENKATSLLRNSIQRKTQLEKIIFSYHNLHNLKPCYTEIVQKAFDSNDPLALWNYENDFILNSRDVEELMNQQCTSYSNYNEQSNHVNQNWNSLVHALDAPYHNGLNNFPAGQCFEKFTRTVPPPGAPIFNQQSTNQSTIIPGSAVPVLSSPSYPQAQYSSAPSISDVGIPGYSASSGHSPMMCSINNFSYPPTSSSLFRGYQEMQSTLPLSGHSVTPAVYNAAYNSQGYNPPCEPILHNNHPDVVYDANGLAYRRMIVTSTVLVPILQTKPAPSTAQSSSSRQSDVSFTVASDQQTEFHNKIKKDVGTVRRPILNEEIFSKNDFSTSSASVGPQDLDLESVETDSALVGSRSSATSPEIMPDLDDGERAEKAICSIKNYIGEPCEKNNEERVHTGTCETNKFVKESITPTSEFFDMDSGVDIRSNTSLSEAMKYKDADDEDDGRWMEVSNRRKYCAPMKIENDVVIVADAFFSSSLVKTVKIGEFGKFQIGNFENEQDPKTTPIASSPLPTSYSSKSKKKLTRKEKRARAAQKAKEMETDDVILEEALKEKMEFLARAGSIDSGVSSGSYNANSDKKKKRINRKIVLERVSVSAPKAPKVKLHILHAVQRAISNRAEKIEQSGRPTTDEIPLRQEYYDKVCLFEKSWKYKTGDLDVVSNFINERISTFKKIQRPQSFSRIMIYEQLLANLPRAFIPELCFLSSLFVAPNDRFEIFEEVFFNLF